MLGHNKVCEIEDFSQSDFKEIHERIFQHEIELYPEIFSKGVADSKQWEITMAVRALQDFGALHKDAKILGVGAGMEVTSFYLTKVVGQVYATDLYLQGEDWSDVAPSRMLVDPESFSPFESERDRLIVQHMDGRMLRYPDNSFDGIFSSGSIEHFGGFRFVANSAYEMGRVLKPGGVLTLATEYMISGPPGGIGWDDGTVLFGEKDLYKYIVEASGLDLVDELDTSLSEKTLTLKRDLGSFLSNMKKAKDRHSRLENFPNLILVHEGYVFCSVFMTLIKTESYPSQNNSWAKPDEMTKTAVEDLARTAASVLTAEDAGLIFQPAISQGSQGTIEPKIHEAPDRATLIDPQLDQHFATWNLITQKLDGGKFQQLPRAIHFIYRTLVRIRRLGQAWLVAYELFQSIIRTLHSFNEAHRLNDRSLREIQAKKAITEERIEALEKTIVENKAIYAEGLYDLERRIGDVSQIQIEIDELRKLLEDRARREDYPIVEQRIRELDEKLIEISNRQHQVKEEAIVLKDNYNNQILELAEKVQDIDTRSRVNTSYLRLMKPEIEEWILDETNSPIPISPDELPTLISMIEEYIPELHDARSIELSIQDSRSDELLYHSARYLRTRLHPVNNDAWYHVDASSQWNFDEMFPNAATKLKLGGRIILIMNSSISSKPREYDGFVLEFDEPVECYEKFVRVVIYQKVE